MSGMRRLKIDAAFRFSYAAVQQMNPAGARSRGGEVVLPSLPPYVIRM